MRHRAITRPLALTAVWMAGTAAVAHPLGNSSVTHFSILYVLPDRVELDLVLDIAEEPSRVIRTDEIDADRDGLDTIAEQKAWVARKAVELAPQLTLHIDGRSLAFHPVKDEVDAKSGRKEITQLILKIPGVLEMPTYRTIIRYAAEYAGPLSAGEHNLSYEDATFDQHPGLRRMLLDRTAGVEVVGARPLFLDEGPDPFIYEQYDPGNLPQERKTSFRFRLVHAVSAPSAVVPDAGREHVAPSVAASEEVLPAFVSSLTDPRNNPAKSATYYRQADRLIGLLQGRWGVTMLLTVTLLAFSWGAAHALMPGHAKTVVAAYLISQHGTYRHAVILAVIVTITHTALVVAMGLIIWLYQARHPNLGPTLQLWLGTIAGVLVAIMGGTLIWRGLTGYAHHHEHSHDHAELPWWRRLLTHSHPHVPAHADAERHEHHHRSHDHHHHSRDHDHPHPHHHGGAVNCAPEVREGQISLKLLVMMGVTGGIVPCPTAMIIMLLGIGTGVVPGALYAVGMFSLGLALTLMVIGFVALSSRRFAARVLLDSTQESPKSEIGQAILLRLLPAASGAVVLALGIAIAAHYLYVMRTGSPLFAWLG